MIPLNENKNKEDRTAPAKEHVQSFQTDLKDQQKENTVRVNKYSGWSFEQLYTECKNRGLL